jgi:hypothetical protein
MADARALLVAFCEWFAQKQRRNTRFWQTPEEKDAQECPNAHDVAVYLAARQPPGCTCTVIDELGSHEATCPEGFPPPAPQDGPREKFVEFAAKFGELPVSFLAVSSTALQRDSEMQHPIHCGTCKHDEGGGWGCPSRGGCEEFDDWEPSNPHRFCRWCGNVASACACTRASDPRRDKWWVKEHAALGRVVAYECMARRDGLTSFPLAPPRDTLTLAEDDGRASRLPKWEG